MARRTASPPQAEPAEPVPADDAHAPHEPGTAPAANVSAAVTPGAAATATAAAATTASGAETLSCPYCTSAISTAALVCPVCTRDLYLFKPLLEQSRLLGRRLDDALARIADLEARPVQVAAALAPVVDGTSAVSIHAPTTAPPGSKKSGRAQPPRKHAVTLWRAALALALVLVAAHTIIVVAFDLPAIWLRLVCVVMPIPFGYWMAGPRRRPVVPLIVAAVLVATLVPLMMSAIVAALDHTSILPADPRELQEFISFALSIGLSLGTGMLLGRAMTQVDKSTFEEASRTYGRVSNFIHRFSPELVRQNFESWQKALLALVAVCTTAGSMVSGLKDVVGERKVVPDRQAVGGAAAHGSSLWPGATPAPGAAPPPPSASAIELHPLLGEPVKEAIKHDQ